jgi:hypothetical protein
MSAIPDDIAADELRQFVERILPPRERMLYCAERLPAKLYGAGPRCHTAPMHVAARLTGYDSDTLRARVGLVRRRGFDGAVAFLDGITRGRPFCDMTPIDPEMVGWVYRAECEDEPVVKIGFSRDPDKRMISLRSRYGPSMRLVSATAGTMLDEFAEHRRLLQAGMSIHGEWFWKSETSRGERVPRFILAHYSPAFLEHA